MIYDQSSIIKIRELSKDFLEGVSDNFINITSSDKLSFNSVFSLLSNLSHPSIDAKDMILGYIFFDYLSCYSRSNILSNVFIKPIKDIKKYKSVSLSILDYTNSIISELRLISDVEYNLIGGKVPDILNNISMKDSSGDFDFWVTSADPNGQTMFVIDAIKDHIKMNKTRFNVDDSESNSYKLTLYDICDENNPIKIQVMALKDTFTINDIFTKFDFLHCCIGYDGKNLFWKKGALKAVKNKQIKMNNILPTRLSHERLCKYIQRGYNINYYDMVILGITSILGALTAPDISTNVALTSNHDDDRWLNLRLSAIQDYE